MNWSLNLKKSVRFFFSLWIVYHVFVITVMPNGTSYVGRYLQSLVVPYATTLGMHASWNFFSPDPAHTMYFHYRIYYQNEMGEDIKEPEDHYFPEQKNAGIWDLSKKRELYAMRYMVLDPQRIQSFFGPWVCKNHPGSTAIQMEHVIEPIPSLDMAVVNKSSSLDEISQKSYEYLNSEYRCSQLQDEVSQ